MSRFSKVIAGTRKRVEAILPLPGASFDFEKGVWSGPIEHLHLRALRDDEHAEVLKNARAFAKSHGVEEPENGDPLYDMGRWLHTLAIAAIDRESSDESPQLYFDGGWEQIHKSEYLTPEIIAYLYKQQVMHQEAVNPLAKTLTNEEFMHAVTQMAGGNLVFFVSMHAAMQWSCVHTLANLHLTSLATNSASTQSSAQQPTETTS